ncbi:MAG: SDR family NAD(P)-dependent oxidoreductase, partial [Isosphaeraceae bacterium]
MNGKVCVVTGATSGIGEVAAIDLARRGARVLIVGRSAERCAATLERVREAAGGDPSMAESFVADLSSQAEVRRVADAIGQRCDRLDVLQYKA